MKASVQGDGDGDGERKPSRRQFFKSAGLAGGAIAVGYIAGRVQGAPSSELVIADDYILLKGLNSDPSLQNGKLWFRGDASQVKVSLDGLSATVFETQSNKGAASGYASLGANSFVPTAQLGSGVADGSTVLKGDQTWGSVPAPTHNLLSATHPDTVVASPIRGDIVVADLTPKWVRLAKGTAGQVLHSDGTDTAWATLAFSELSGGITDAQHGVRTLANAHKYTDLDFTSSNITSIVTRSHGSMQDLLNDDHTQYQKESEKDAANGYAGLDASSNVNANEVVTGSVEDNAITNAKLADMAANTVKANATAAPADPADLAVGTNTVVGRAAGNIVAAQLATGQIADNAVDNTKLRDSAGFSVIGKTATGSGDPADIVAADETVFGRTAAGNLVFAQLATGQIANDAVTYAKIQNVTATSRFLGRITAGAGDTEELTGTQATTLLDLFTTTLKGLVPGSGGGTTNFLRADGTWAAPPSGSGLSVTLVSGSSGAANGAAAPSETWLVLTADQINGTTTNAVFMTLTSVPIGTYWFRVDIRGQSAAATTAMKFAVDYTGTVTFIVYHFFYPTIGVTASTGVADQAQNTTTGQIWSANSARADNTTLGPFTDVDTANADMHYVIEGMMKVSTSANLTILFGSEVAANTTVMAGSTLVLKRFE